jgi:hypothetical protein
MLMSEQIVNQAKYKQMPSMTVIAFIGWVVNFHSSKYFKSNAQVSNTLGALAIGIAANAHARFGRHIENWSLDMWENNMRPHAVKARKLWQRKSHGPIRSARKIERSEYDPTHNGSGPNSSHAQNRIRACGSSHVARHLCTSSIWSQCSRLASLRTYVGRSNRSQPNWQRNDAKLRGCGF